MKGFIQKLVDFLKRKKDFGNQRDKTTKEAVN